MFSSKTLRLLRMGFSTVLGLKKQGFFIPYRYAENFEDKLGESCYRTVEKHFNCYRTTFQETLSLVNEFSEDLSKIGPNNPPQPRWDQNWFPLLDAVIAYVMVRTLMPQKIIEVGSGHSTRFLSRAANDGHLSTHITSIDPSPRALIKGLDIEIIKSTVQKVKLDYFLKLLPGDILFIDSSHILMPGTDVDFLFNRILGILPSGVVLHIHDIFLPDNYPDNWKWRGYNEQLGVAMLLQGNQYEVLFSSRFVSTRMKDYLNNIQFLQSDVKENTLESSLWLVKR